MSDQRLPFGVDRPKPALTWTGSRQIPDVGFAPVSSYPVNGEQARGAVTLDGTWLVLTFSHKYAPFFRAVKSIKGAHELPVPRFDSRRVSWLVHIGNIRQVRHLAQIHRWEVSDAVAAIPDLDPGDVPLLISAEGEQLVLIGAYREETWKVLTEGGASYERRSGRWFIPYERALDVVFDLQKIGTVRFVGDRNELMDRLDEATAMLRLSRALTNVNDFQVTDRVKRELRAFQVPGVDYMVRSRRAFNWATTGAGKGLRNDQRVLTPAGWVPISSLRPGDMVIGGSTGTPVEVLGVYPQPSQPLWEMTTNDGRKVVCDAAHRWNVQIMRSANEDWRTCSTTDMLEPGLFEYAQTKPWGRQRRLALPLPPRVDEGPNLEDAYRYGVWLGDGTWNRGNCTVDTNIEDAPAMAARCGSSRVAQPEPSKQTGQFGLGKSFGLMVADDGMAGANSHQRYVPLRYLHASEATRLAILQGLMDTDGTADRRHSGTEFSSTSERLIDDVVDLVRSLGGIARRSGPRITHYTHLGERRDGRPSWRANIKLPAGMCPFFVPRKADSYIPPTKYPPRTIIDRIERVADGPSTCIAVADPDGLFITEDYIVTHNTQIAIAAAEHLDAYPLLVVAPSGLKTNWQREFTAVVPHRTVFICEGRTPELPSDLPDAFVVNYDVVHFWRTTFAALGLRCLIVDEGHRLGNPKTRWTKAVAEISTAMPYDAARFDLTATPVRNRRGELVPQLAAIGREGEFGDRKQLRADDRLSRRMRTVCAWRPDPEEVLKSLGVVGADGQVYPVENRIVVDGDPTVMAEYRHAEANILEYLMQAAAAKAREIGDDPNSAAVEAAMKLENAKHLMVINTLVTVANRAKIKPTVEWVGDFAESGDKILVFAERVAMMDAVSAATDWPQIRGGVSKKRRVEIEDTFQGRTGGDVQGIVLQYQSGGEGLTLTEAHHILHAELRWSPGDHIQANGRCIVAGSLVHTRRGMVPIELVLVGDEVLTHRGRWKPVTATAQREASETVEIETVRHLDRLRCTPDHLLWVKDSVSGRIDWKPAGHLEPSDLLALPRPTGPGVTEVHFDMPDPDLSCLGCHQEVTIVTHGLCQRCRYQYQKADRPFPDEYITAPEKRRLTSIRPGPVQITNELLWAFGVWLGDGWLKRTKMVHHAVGICGHANEHTQVTRAITTISDAFGVEMTSPMSTQENSCQMYLYSRELADLFADWFFAVPPSNNVKDTGKGSQGVVKRLAPWMADLDDDQASALLHGYVAADGHWSPVTGAVNIKTISPHLAHQAAALAARCGFAPSVNRLNHGPKQRQPYLVSWQRREPTRMRTDLRQSDADHVWCPVARVRSVREAVTVHDLTVDDDHSFVVGQAAVHNCWMRMNDPHNITAHFLVCADTIDEIRMDVLDHKSAEMATVTDGDRMGSASGSTFDDVLSILLRRALGQ